MQPQLRQIPNGALVQLVRMPACHAGGHGFESRTHRQKTYKSAIKIVDFFIYYHSLYIMRTDHPINIEHIIIGYVFLQSYALQ